MNKIIQLKLSLSNEVVQSSSVSHLKLMNNIITNVTKLLQSNQVTQANEVNLLAV